MRQPHWTPVLQQAHPVVGSPAVVANAAQCVAGEKWSALIYAFNLLMYLLLRCSLCCPLQVATVIYIYVLDVALFTMLSSPRCNKRGAGLGFPTAVFHGSPVSQVRWRRKLGQGVRQVWRVRRKQCMRRLPRRRLRLREARPMQRVPRHANLEPKLSASWALGLRSVWVCVHECMSMSMSMYGCV